MSLLTARNVVLFWLESTLSFCQLDQKKITEKMSLCITFQTNGIRGGDCNR